MSKFEEAKKLMEMLGIPFADNYSYANNMATTGMQNYQASNTGNQLTYMGATTYCYCCNSYSCQCHQNPSTNTSTYKSYGTTGYQQQQFVPYDMTLVNNATVDIKDLYDILTDPEKLKEMLSKLKMKAFW